MSYELTPHSSADEWQRVIVRELADAIRHDLETREKAVLCLAGGSTPFPIYAALASESLDWSRVTVIPGDDRCVAHSDTHSNFGQLKVAFTNAAGITVESLTVEDGDAERSLEHARAVLGSMWDPFTAVVLGLGNDMHTASLFPGSKELAEGIAADNELDALIVVPDPLPVEAPYPRISLTANRLRRASKTLLAIRGDAKRQALQKALRTENPMLAPIMAIIGDELAQTDIHWSP